MIGPLGLFLAARLMACVPWVNGGITCLNRSSGDFCLMTPDVPVCQFDDGVRMYPDPCRQEVTPGEWLVVRTPRVK